MGRRPMRSEGGIPDHDTRPPPSPLPVGPKQDIIVPTMEESTDEGVGYLASDVESFALAMQSALRLPPDARRALVERARTRSHRFSDGKFALAFEELSAGLFAGAR